MEVKTPSGEMEKAPSCCAPKAATSPVAASSCCAGEKAAPAPADAPPAAPEAKSVPTALTWADRLAHARCRLTAYRMSYTVAPGLYFVGSPTKDSEVFVSANYKLSFDHLRSALDGMDAWILVLDTKGINVWCAAGKGTFGTDELVERIFKTQLYNVVAHKRIIVPQLGGPGVSAHKVKLQTGFRVYFGPVYARDIGAYVAAGLKATPEMRRIGFSFTERLVLTPMEINPAMKKYPLYALAVLLFFGLQPTGVLFGPALSGGLPFLLLGLASVLAGAFLTPLFIGFIPGRSFAVKGWLTGAALTLLYLFAFGTGHGSTALSAFSCIFFPAMSSYIALQFTGSTVFTNMSGVKKELKYAVPAYLSAMAVSTILLLIFKLKEWGAI